MKPGATSPSRSCKDPVVIVREHQFEERRCADVRGVKWSALMKLVVGLHEPVTAMDCDAQRVLRDTAAFSSRW